MTSRDNLALCAMQVLLKESCKEHTPFLQRIKKMLGMNFYTATSYDPDSIARDAYEIADAMIDASESEE